MFGAWQVEKATAALVAEAQAMADRLESAKPHAVEMHAAAAQVWAAVHLAKGEDLAAMVDWPAADLARFVRAAQTRISALRKSRDYSGADGLATWLHTARAVSEPRIAPAVRAIWTCLGAAGVNVESMVADQLEDAGLPPATNRHLPKGFSAAG
jgi:hypothetical protein